MGPAEAGSQSDGVPLPRKGEGHHKVPGDNSLPVVILGPGLAGSDLMIGEAALMLVGAGP
jgi:hypothetical protein